MKKSNLFLLAMLALSINAFGQECDCESNFNWTRKTFEENDAGFQYIIDQKGHDAYGLLNEKIMEKAKNAKTLSECQTAIYEWSKFFRTGHFGFTILKSGYYSQSPVIDAKKIKEQPVVKVDYAKFEKRINSIPAPTIEGIWNDGTYKVGIVNTKEGYKGFIISAGKTGWEQNQLKFVISNDKKKAELWIRDFSKRENLKVDLIGSNLINIGNIMYLKRESRTYEDTQATKDYIRFLYAGTKPYFQQLSEKTSYIRIPAFDLDYKKQIDSVITANTSVIEKVQNFIIDVRYNGGGADICYEKLIPFLYTDPIRTVGVQHLSTPLNNKMMLSLSENANFDKEHQTAYKEAYETLNKNIGKFVSLSDDIVKVKKLDQVLPFPKNIAIIINNGNASTTEQFLLAAKQSKKTKLFGTTTSGALDISNMNDAVSPDGNFELSYCRSKSYRIPEMAIDGKGIQPDYYLDESIADKDWAEYVRKIVEE
ncbi:S41 family peptidase [uncultured Flavobacterium sp.]|uniref:S41 family peptidase n=1 Tax=uncultured Flavobacterium sp. TaxID=165435 RepID=UPI0025D7C172|nr:S41 family peptidase [uncultured Flavobacterium sp.]